MLSLLKEWRLRFSIVELGGAQRCMASSVLVAVLLCPRMHRDDCSILS